MPQFLEDRLRAAGRKKGFSGERLDQYVYGAMNNMGAMHGSKETAKGAAMQEKHDRDMKAKRGPRKIRVRRNRNLIPI